MELNVAVIDPDHERDGHVRLVRSELNYQLSSLIIIVGNDAYVHICRASYTQSPLQGERGTQAGTAFPH